MKLIGMVYFLHMISITLIPGQALASMSLFNDDGNWQLGTLGYPEDGNAVYRACKNSSDRINTIEVPESRAIFCITFSQASGAISADIWLDEEMDENVHSVHCLLVPDNDKPVSVICDVKPSKIAKLQIKLTNNVTLIQKLLKASKLKIIFKNKFLMNNNLDALEFEPDAVNFATAAPVIFEVLQNQQ